MDLKQIEAKLNSEFQSDSRKLVFWFDEKGQFVDDIDLIKLENAQVYRLEKDNTFYTKYFFEKEYLHKVQRVYESESARMQDVIDNSTDAREVAFARKQKEKLTKQLLETKEYDEVLGHIALQRIALDLDDGVVVNYQKFQNIDVISNNRAVKKNLLVDIYKGKK